MKKKIFALLVGLSFSIAVFSESTTPTSFTDIAPILPKVWTGISGDTSIGAISRKNPLHYLHVGEANQVKGWNKYDGPATLTILKQDGRHLDIEFKNSKYQINEVGTLSADGKQIQITSKEATALFTIEGDKLAGCGTSQGTNGLFGHWLSDYSVWCDEYTVSTSVPSSSTKTVATLPKVWTGILSATNFGGPTQHVPNHKVNIGKGKVTKGWTTHDEAPRTITIIRQEGRHIEFLYKSPRAETKFIGMLSSDGKQMQVSSGYSTGIWNVSEDKISGCAISRGMDGDFTHWFNNYQSYCVDFLVGENPPAFPQNVPKLSKEWRGMYMNTSVVAQGPDNSNHTNLPRGWNTVKESTTLTILRQEGTHLEFLMKSPRGESRLIGTLSLDGKQLKMASKTHDLSMTLSGNIMSGCGSARGEGGIFSNWINSYSAYCFEYSVVK